MQEENPLRTAWAERAWVTIDLHAIRRNVAALQAWVGPDAQILAVVKADAYGHGLIPVAQAALFSGAAWLGVATAHEGAQLREAGVTSPILLVCNVAPLEMGLIITHSLTPMIGDMPTLRRFLEVVRYRAQRDDQSALPAVHLDVDTGMGRSGVQPTEAVALWRAMIASGLRVTGLATHFADACDYAMTDIQRHRFAAVEKALRSAGAAFDHVHLSASEATLLYKRTGGNLVRPGLLLYGLVPPAEKAEGTGRRGEEETVSAPANDGTIEDRKSKIEKPELCPALSLKARVATVRDLPAGATISYGATRRLARASRVATVLIGYGDGYPRRLSNRGAMLLHGKRAPILGRVCMDQTVVDVTDIPETCPGDVAVCIGTQGKIGAAVESHITVEEIADAIDTIAHEIVTALTARLPRNYVGE